MVSYGARAHDMDAAHPVGPTSGTWAQIRPPGAAREPPGPPKGALWAKVGPFVINKNLRIILTIIIVILSYMMGKTKAMRDLLQ